MTKIINQLLKFKIVILMLLPLTLLYSQSQDLNNSQNLESQFQNPDKIYAPFFFWFWDAPLDTEQTQQSIQNIATKSLEQGFNPGYIHPRFNMVGEPDLPLNQWLSPIWFETVKTILPDIQKHQSYLGFCNEFWWPSGYAAGRTLEENPDLWAQSLYWDTIDIKGGETVKIPPSFFAIAAELAPSNDGKTQLELLNIKRKAIIQKAANDSLEIIPHTSAMIRSHSQKLIGQGDEFSWTSPKDGDWRVYVFNKYYHPGCDGGRLNYLDKRLARTFLKNAHEAYKINLKEHLGKTIPGFFVDHEGDYGYKMAWSTDLQKHFQQKTGRDIRLDLPLLVDKDDEGFYAGARYNWFDCVTDLYGDFFTQINDWCAQNNMYAISNLWEETLMWQAGAVGDFYKIQRTFSMPGTDALGLNILNPHDFMETKSVCQFEGRRFQSEIMGGSGFWGYSNRTIKQAANAAITWGINHIVPHSIFTTRKLEGNPWLPDWFEQNPFWPTMHLWSDFVRRASFINDQGHIAVDVLLLTPMESVWELCGPGVFDPAYKGRTPGPAIQTLPTKLNIKRTAAEIKEQSAWWCPPNMNYWFDDHVVEIDSIYNQAMNDLISNRIEFLISDRFYFDEMQIDGPVVNHGPFSFKIIVLPKMTVISLSVAEKLLTFAQNGGHVVILNSQPIGSTEQKPDIRIQSIFAKLLKSNNVELCDNDFNVFIKTNQSIFNPKLVFASGEFPLLQQHRCINNNDFFWLANNSGKPQFCILKIANKKSVPVKWDCETGTTKPLNFEIKNDSLFIPLDFSHYEGFWLELSETKPKTESKAFTVIDEIVLDSQFQVRIDSTQQPTNIDHPTTYPTKFTTWTDKNLEDWKIWELHNFSGVVEYEKIFDLSSKSDKIELDLGNVECSAQVWLNGQKVGDKLWPPYTFDITKESITGKNKLLIRVGNLLNNSFGDPRSAGLFGPVKIILKNTIKE